MTLLRNGWEETQQRMGTKVIQAVYNEPYSHVPKGLNYELDTEIKYKLIAEIVKNLFNSPNLVHIEKQFQDYDKRLSYRAKLVVSEQPNNWNYVIGKSFFVNGVEFTETQIIDAIINTYPELVI